MTPLRVHEKARRERLHAKRTMRDPNAALRFDAALREVFARIKQGPN